MKKSIFLIIILLLVPMTAISSHYTINGDGTVTDNVTGLMWQQEDDDNIRTWEEAVSYCENLFFPPSKYSDWRLPDLQELRSIVAEDQYNPAIDTTSFPNTNSSNYWSSREGDRVLAWYVAFYEGASSNSYKIDSNYARCVRGKQ